jgi:hypothetical protein
LEAFTEDLQEVKKTSVTKLAFFGQIDSIGSIADYGENFDSLVEDITVSISLGQILHLTSSKLLQANICMKTGANEEEAKAKLRKITEELLEVKT